MSQYLVTVLLFISFLCVSWSVGFFFISSWQKKHRLYYAVYRYNDTDRRYFVAFFRSKSDLNSWLDTYSSVLYLFGVYSLVPDSYLKEYGGFYSRSK